MAALLLRLGRAGSLKESWAALQKTPAVTFATNVEEPKKSGKKPKAAKGADDQGVQLASKTLVAFPCKVALPAVPPVPPVQALGSSSSGQGPAVTHQADAPSTSTASVTPETVTLESARQAEVESITSIGASEPGIGTKSTGTTITEPAAKAPVNEDGTFGSSSSSSDSDSDSDSDDEKEQEKAEPWADGRKKPEGGDEAHSPTSSQSNSSSAATDVSPDVAPGASSEFLLTAASGVTSKDQSEEVSAVPLSSVQVAEEKYSRSGVKEAVPSRPFEGKFGASADASSNQTTTMSSKKLGDPVPMVATPKDPSAPGAAKEAATEAAAGAGKGAATEAAAGAGKGARKVVTPEAAPGAGKGAGKVVTPEAAPEAGKGAHKVVTPEVAPGAGKGAGSKVVTPEAAPGAGKGAGSKVVAPGAAPGAALEDTPGTGKVAARSEELVDPAPVLSEAAAKEMKPDAEAEALQSPDEVAPSPAEPEPFDNSSYKNLQHHSYHQYTFVDMEVEMAKYRLPQPSSGRPSPRH